MRCSCSGTVIFWSLRVITLLTSANLVRSSHDESKIDEDLTVGAANHVHFTLSFEILIKSHFIIQIRVWNRRYPYVGGWLEQYDLQYNVALVNIQAHGFLCPASLHHQMQPESGSKVIAVGCLFDSRKLMATSGIVMDKMSRFGNEEFLISTCKISKVHYFDCSYSRGGNK